jgi:hypothetical protein
MEARDESRMWEADVLGEQYQLYANLLIGAAGAEDLPSRALNPMQQIMVANALRVTNASTAFVREHETSPNSLIINKLLQRATTAQTNLLLHHGEDPFSWFPLSSFNLRSLGPSFNESVSVLLKRANAAGMLEDSSRMLLNHLLFHPLQNARQHGILDDPRGFSGMTVRLVASPAPETTSVSEYLSDLATHQQTHQFLEIIIHDDGPGIANHYFRAKSAQAGNRVRDIYALDLAREWVTLRSAFERHATSKYFQTASSRLAEPGIGLAALMGSIKWLKAYMELRTGRLRVYRWFRPGDQIHHEDMILPRTLGMPLGALPGTIFRFFIPLVLT